MNTNTSSQPQPIPSTNPIVGADAVGNESKLPRAFIRVIPIVFVPLPQIARMHIPNTDIPEKMFSKSTNGMKLRRRCIDKEKVRRLATAKLTQVQLASPKRRKTYHSVESDMLESDLEDDLDDSDEF